MWQPALGFLGISPAFFLHTGQVFNPALANPGNISLFWVLHSPILSKIFILIHDPAPLNRPNDRCALFYSSGRLITLKYHKNEKDVHHCLIGYGQFIYHCLLRNCQRRLQEHARHGWLRRPLTEYKHFIITRGCPVKAASFLMPAQIHLATKRMNSSLSSA